MSFHLAVVFTLLCLALESRAEINRFEAVPEQDGQTYIFRGSESRGHHQGDYDQIRSVGVGTVVCLKEADDHCDEKLVARAGMRYESVPLRGAGTPNISEIASLRALLDEIEKAKQGKPSRVKLPVFVHCKSGKDRTGFLLYLYRVEKQGLDPGCALAEMDGFGPKHGGLWDYIKRDAKRRLGPGSLDREPAACQPMNLGIAKRTKVRRTLSDYLAGRATSSYSSAESAEEAD